MKQLMLLLIILLAGCQTQKPPPAAPEEPMQMEDNGPIDPADPPRNISVKVQLLEYPVPDVSAELTKVVFVWRGAVSEPIYIVGDQRNNLRVGQVLKNCTIWDLYYKGERPDYIYELDYEPFKFPHLLYFPKNQVNLDASDK